STAGIESDHRSPRCHGFDRQDAEVFFTGEDQGTATGQMVAQDVEGLVAQELYGRARGLSQYGCLRSLSDDHEALAHAGEGPNCEVGPLVGHQLPCTEIKIPSLGGCLELVDGHRRVDHVGVHLVEASNASGHMLRIGYERIDSRGGAHIPDPQGRGGERHHRPPETAEVTPVDVIMVPDVPQRTVAVADVNSVRPGDDALCRPGLARDHQVVRLQIEILESEGHQRQQLRMMPSCARQSLKKRRVYPLALQEGGKPLPVADQREDVRLREQLAELLHDLLTTAHGEQPVMNDSHLHGKCTCSGMMSAGAALVDFGLNASTPVWVPLSQIANLRQPLARRLRVPVIGSSEAGMIPRLSG